MVNCVCGITLCLTSIFAVGSTIETASLAPEIILSFFKDLEGPTPTVVTTFLSAAIFIRVVTAFCILFNTLEFLCYGTIFLEMHRHHKRHTNLCLSNKPKLANMKKKQNTITAVGQFVSWVVEMVIFGLLQYILVSAKENIYHQTMWIFYSVLMPSINYLTFPLVQAIASKDLREHVFNVECCTQSCFCTSCITRGSGQNVQGAAPGNIQLQVMQNGHALQV